MQTQSRVAPHAADKTPQQAEELKATLRQVSELVGLVDRGKISRQYMQDFLRFRLGSNSVETRVAPADNELLNKIESSAREHFPGQVNEILEVVAPWCDANLSMEFSRPSPDDRFGIRRAAGVETVRLAHEALVGWYPYRTTVELVQLDPEYATDPKIGDRVCHCRDLASMVLAERMFTKQFETVCLADHRLDKGIGTLGLYEVFKHVRHAMFMTGACKHQLLRGFEIERIGGSILEALYRAVAFAVIGDEEKLEIVQKFLSFQRSGTPIVAVGDTTFVLTAPYSR